jgi:hypothetical protein
VVFYYDAKLKGKIKIENMASPRRLPMPDSKYESNFCSHTYYQACSHC